MALALEAVSLLERTTVTKEALEVRSVAILQNSCNFNYFNNRLHDWGGW